MMNKTAIGTLILRIVLGVTFFVHGLVKFQDGIGGTVEWFSSLGLPGFLAYVVAIVELVGGIMLILGLFSRVVSGLLAVIMAGAIVTAKLPAGFLGNGQTAGYELDLALLAIALFIALSGSRTASLDQIISKERKTEDSAA